MGHCFSHLTKADRYKIEALLNNGHSAKEIAAEIHVHISTIYREIKRARMVHRNSDWTEEERYNPDEAHRRYRENLSAKGAPLKIGRDYALAEYLERKVLEEGRSPRRRTCRHCFRGAGIQNYDLHKHLLRLHNKGRVSYADKQGFAGKGKTKAEISQSEDGQTRHTREEHRKTPRRSGGARSLRTLGNGYRLQREADFKESPSCADGAEDATRNYRAYAGSDGGKHHKGT